MLKIVSIVLYPLTLYRVLDFISLIKCVITKKEAETQVPNFLLIISSLIRERDHSGFLLRYHDLALDSKCRLVRICLGMVRRNAVSK